MLTDGFVTVQEGTQIVLLEGQDDPPFYTLVWELLTERSAISAPGPLERSPGLTFLYGQGKNTVELIVPQMRRHGLLNFHGIIDRDRSNTPSDGIHVLGRNAMENYLFDPINVWFALHLEGQAPSVPGVNLLRGRGDIVRGFPEEQLQQIADAVLNRVEASLTDLRDDERDREGVTFVNGKRVMYPRWFLDRDDKQMKGKFRQEFRYRYDLLTDQKILRSYEMLNLIPRDLLELMQTIQAISRTRS